METVNMMKYFSRVFVSVIIICGLFSVSIIPFGFAQNGLITFITSDTVWTKDNSVYSLSGPIVISSGVTLTINPGVTVDLNGYYIFVNGTLQGIGSDTETMQINGGEILYGDNDQVGLNSIFENTIINSTISSNKPLILNNNIINVGVTVGANSVISNNVVLATINTGDNAIVLNNDIKADLSVGDSSRISDNTIEADVTAGSSAKILSNTINGSRIYFMPYGGHASTIALTVGGLSEISNNTILGGVKATSSTISNNTISGGAPFTDWAGRGGDSTSAVEVSGESSITFNVISSATGGYGVLIRGGNTYISGNVIQNTIRVAGDALIEENMIFNGGIQVGHIFVSAFNDIDYGYGDSIIRNNIIMNSSTGVYSYREGGTAIIEQNLIVNNSRGISGASQMTIINNTITDNTEAINLGTSSVMIEYNNIINYSQNSLSLSSVPTVVNALHNWWGTTDTQAINLTIHDFKYDITLGKVSFVPLLALQNPYAPSTSFSLPTPPITPGITIHEPEPELPIASFTYSPLGPQVNDTITFDSSGCSDSDGTIVSYSWDFGDGTTSTSHNPTHIYAQEGSYTVTLTITDNDGLKDSITMSLGEILIPEFPSWILLPLFLISTLAVTVYRRKMKRTR